MQTVQITSDNLIPGALNFGGPTQKDIGGNPGGPKPKPQSKKHSTKKPPKKK